MEITPLTGSMSQLSTVEADALLLVIHGGDEPCAFAPVDHALREVIEEAVAHGDLVLKPGNTLYLHRPQKLGVRRVLLCVAASVSAQAVRHAVASGLGALKSAGIDRMVIAAACPMTAAHAEAIAVALGDASYVYRQTKPSAPVSPGWRQVALLCQDSERREVERGIELGRAISVGAALARECANLPGNLCTPSYLATVARLLGEQHGLAVEVFDRMAVSELGMGAFLAVAQGSDEPLQFIVMRYDGAPADGRYEAPSPVVLVGKGITFDSGGLCIKPRDGQREMKFDMGGAAAVLGTMAAIAQLKPRLNVVALIPCCENMPDGRAVKPGDVVKTMSGQTVEVLNTDAEGRLVLCDALTYAERFNPKVVVDVATLTGACVVALGHHQSGLFSPDELVAAQLIEAGHRALDPCWRLPLSDEYDKALDSLYADMSNVGPSTAAGAVTAAMFLKRFTASYAWAHLDVSGVARSSGDNKGGTGRPVPLLTHFVLMQQE